MRTGLLLVTALAAINGTVAAVVFFYSGNPVGLLPAFAALIAVGVGTAAMED